jgi:hypothetical protein
MAQCLCGDIVLRYLTTSVYLLLLMTEYVVEKTYELAMIYLPLNKDT